MPPISPRARVRPSLTAATRHGPGLLTHEYPERVIVVPDFGRRRLKQIFRAPDRGDSFSPELNPWEHLNYFDWRSLAKVVAAAGLRAVEAPGPVDIGLRPRQRGLRRWTNVLRSAGRLGRYAFSGVPTTGIMVARK